MNKIATILTDKEIAFENALRIYRADDVFSPADVAAILGTSTMTVLRYAKAGLFPNAFKRGEGRNAPWVIPKEDVSAYVLKVTNVVNRDS